MTDVNTKLLVIGNGFFLVLQDKVIMLDKVIIMTLLATWEEDT